MAAPSLGQYAALSFVVRRIRSRLESRSHREWRTVERVNDRWLEVVSLSVISYLLFGRSVAMNYLDDFNDFYDLTN